MARKCDGELNCPGARPTCNCFYCFVAFFGDPPSDTRVNCGIIGNSELGIDPCDPAAPCHSPFQTLRATPTLGISSPSTPPLGDGGGPHECGCSGTLKRFCYCTADGNGFGPIAADNIGNASLLLAMAGISVRTLYESDIPCQHTTRGACCHEDGLCQENVLPCGCFGEFHPDQTCVEAGCTGPLKRCCHCDWCCKVGTGGITEAACTAAGGSVQNGACPSSGPCANAPCKPCELEGFSVAQKVGTDELSSVGYQPVAGIRAIDTPVNADPLRMMVPSLACRDNGTAYAAEFCSIYNRRIGGADVTLRRAVSECALSAVGSNENYYQFICAYREPCSEPPAGCVRTAA